MATQILRARSSRASAVFAFVVAVYLFFFSAYPISGDEFQLYDAARSIARDGSLALVYTNDLITPITPADPAALVPSLNTKAASAYLSAGLIEVASWLPGVGLAHAAWLINLLATALTAMLLYLWGGALGYSERAALLTALLYATATIALPYSTYFFREPLLTLAAVLAGYAFTRWRQATPFAALAAGLAALGLLFFTKDSGYFLLPAIVIFALPSGWGVYLRPSRHWLPFLLIGGLLWALLAGLILWRSPELLGRFTSGRFFADYLSYAPTAIAAYLFSPGFSVWAFSPILLAGWLGFYRLWRAGQWQLALAPLLALLLMVISHATLHGAYWYGGLGWGPRFLVPVIPFLALWLLPVIAQASKPTLRGILLLLAIFSMALQSLAAYLPMDTYSRNLPEGVFAWQEGLWGWNYLPQVVTLRAFSQTYPAPLWAHVSDSLPALLLVLIALVAVAFVVWRSKRLAWLPIAAGLAAIVLSLRLYYHDPRYGGADSVLWQALASLTEKAQAGDGLLLLNKTYRPFFMNYLKADMPVLVLPNAGGEILKPGQPPFVPSNNPDERAEPAFQIMLARLANITQRWLVITEFSPFATDVYRVAEHYLARHYFAAETWIDNPRLRLLAYAPQAAPANLLPPWPATSSDLDFGAARLVGFDLASGATLKAGQAVAISLLWRHDGFSDGVRPFNYSVNLSLINAEGVAVAQITSQPQGTFGNMATWQAGGHYRDHRALFVPAGTPLGQYQLWLLVVDWERGLPLPVNGQDHALLATITVRASGP
jgi:hypothetical protein